MHDEQGYNIADSSADFIGWQILNIEAYKPGIVRVSMRKIESDGTGKFLTVYTDEEYIKGLPYRKNRVAKSGRV